MDPTCLMDEILQRLATEPSRPLLGSGRHPRSRFSLAEASGLAAGRLFRAGLRQGDRLLLGLAPGDRFVVSLLGALRLGAIVVPIAAKVRGQQLAHLVADSSPRLALGDDELNQEVRSLGYGTQALTPEELPVWRAQGHPLLQSANASVRLRGDDPALILYTSGTTGRPRGALHSHGSLIANITDLQRCWQLNADDHLLLSLPLYHLHGLVVGLLAGLVTGMQITLSYPFSAATVVARLEAGKCTLFYGVPTQYRQLAETVDAPVLQHMRLFVSGSAALAEATRRAFEDRFQRPLIQRYGTTETGIALSEKPGMSAKGSAGFPLGSVETKVVPDAQEGELWIKGPNLFSGYYQEVQRTADCMSDGFYQSGDWVRRHEDGSYTVLGRAQTEVFQVRGHRVGALEIEAVLCSHPQIAECAVLSLSDDGDVPPLACILLHHGQVDLPMDLQAFAANHLAPYQVPSRFEILAELPRTGPGKVDKKALRRQLLPEPDSGQEA